MVPSTAPGPTGGPARRTPPRRVAAPKCVPFFPPDSRRPAVRTVSGRLRSVSRSRTSLSATTARLPAGDASPARHARTTESAGSASARTAPPGLPSGARSTPRSDPRPRSRRGTLPAGAVCGGSGRGCGRRVGGRQAGGRSARGRGLAPAGGTFFEEGLDPFAGVGFHGVLAHHPGPRGLRLRDREVRLGVEGAFAQADHEGAGGGDLPANSRLAASSSSSGTTRFSRHQSGAVFASPKELFPRIPCRSPLPRPP